MMSIQLVWSIQIAPLYIYTLHYVTYVHTEMYIIATYQKRLSKPGITILLSTNHISAKQHDNINKQASKCHYTDYVDSVETRVSHQTICLLYAEYEYSLPEQIE